MAGCEEPAQKKRKGGVESLNVGGLRIDTTKETLELLPYFRAIYEQEETLGRRVLSDSEGNMFVDRNGELFRVILEYLRTFRRPPKEILQTRGLQLRDEAEFFGCQELLNELDGVTNSLKLEQRDREIRGKEWAILCQLRDGMPRGELLVDVFERKEDFTIKPRSDLRYPLVFETNNVLPPVGERSIVPGNIEEFEARMQTLTNHTLKLLSDPAIVIAGGSVVAALCEDAPLLLPSKGRSRDIDVFLCGLSPTRAKALLDEILSKLNAEHPETFGTERRVVVRSKAAVTIFSMSSSSPPLQIMITLYAEPAEVLLNFDVDCCAALFHPHSRRVLCSPRCQRALNHRTNLLDSDLRNDFYEKRLAKYAARGFAVAVPGLDLTHVERSLFEADYLMLQPFNTLLRLGPKQLDPDGDMTIERRLYTAAGLKLPGDPDAEDAYGVASVSSVRQAQVVPHSLERLLILDRLNVREVACTPKARDCAYGDKPLKKGAFHFAIPAEGGDKDAVSWISFPGHDVSDPRNGSEVNRLHRLVEELKWTALRDQPPQNLEGLPESEVPGVEGSLFGTLHNLAHSRLGAGKQLGYVYSRGSARASTDFVQDAQQAPLRTDLSDAEFEHRYGVTKQLAFTPVTTADYHQHGRMSISKKLRIGPPRPQRHLMHGVYAFAPQ